MDTCSLTYRELADRLGIKLDSARKTAQRKRWPRTTGNDGQVRVMVPADYLDRPKDSHADTTKDSPTDSPGIYTRELELRIEALQALFAAETRRAETAEANSTAWQRHAETLQRQLTDQSRPPQKRRWLGWLRSAA